MGKRRRHCVTSRLLLTCSTSSNGQGHEGNESDGRHEGDEGHEEKVREQDCKGPLCQSLGVSWVQGEVLDDCRPEGQEGTEDHRLRRSQEGLRALQEGQGVLLKMLVMASAQGVGMSTPFERSSPDRIEVVEHR